MTFRSPGHRPALKSLLLKRVEKQPCRCLTISYLLLAKSWFNLGLWVTFREKAMTTPTSSRFNEKQSHSFCPNVWCWVRNASFLILVSVQLRFLMLCKYAALKGICLIRKKTVMKLPLCLREICSNGHREPREIKHNVTVKSNLPFFVKAKQVRPTQ